MGNVTYSTMQKLLAAGFSFPAYDHFLNKGMLFFYKDDEYLIGGNSLDDFSETDRLVAKNGCWLPDESQLLKWLQNCDFDVTIQWNAATSYFSVFASAEDNGTQFTGGGITLVDALAKIIYKICKTRKPPPIPSDVFRIEIK